jgi:S1-C subfamily serine protease
LARIIASKRPGTTMALTLLRDGKTLHEDVRLGASPKASES